MSYSLYIEGTTGARRVRAGRLPRRGEWLSLDFFDGGWWWLPVLEVAHALSQTQELTEPEHGCDWVHQAGEAIVISSLAVAVEAKARSDDESYKLLLPPTRWPYGGREEEEVVTGLRPKGET